MTNAYCDLDLLKAEGPLSGAGHRHDRRLLSLLEEASRWIDAYCNRRFYVVAEPRRFAGSGGPDLPLPELVAVTSLETRLQPAAPPVTWLADDYELHPLDARPNKPWGRPYTRIAVSPATAGRRAFPRGPGTVKITGRWGFREVIAATGTTLAAAGDGITAAATELTAATTGIISPGQTLSLGAEQLYITAVDGVTATVTRGVNGTTAADHPAATPISVYRYPGPVTEACLQLAADWGQRRERSIAAGLTGRDASSRKSGLWKEVKELLAGYRRLAVR